MKFFFCGMLVCLLSAAAFAQPDPAAHERPNALLVELLTYNESIRQMAASNMQAKAALKQKEARRVQSITIRDWSQNFSYCPVYYFLSDSAGAIRQHHYAGILLDSALHPIPAALLPTAGDTTAYIAHYGYLPPDEVEDQYGKASYGPYLVVQDHAFRVLKPQRLRICNSSSAGIFGRTFTGGKGVTSFSSKNFDIDYYPCAGKYQRRLERYFGNHTKK